MLFQVLVVGLLPWLMIWLVCRAALNATELFTVEAQAAKLQQLISEEKVARAAREVCLLLLNPRAQCACLF
jgi:hypothetical protein